MTEIEYEREKPNYLFRCKLFKDQVSRFRQKTEMKERSFRVQFSKIINISIVVQGVHEWITRRLAVALGNPILMWRI